MAVSEGEADGASVAGAGDCGAAVPLGLGFAAGDGDAAVLGAGAFCPWEAEAGPKQIASARRTGAKRSVFLESISLNESSRSNFEFGSIILAF